MRVLPLLLIFSAILAPVAAAGTTYSAMGTVAAANAAAPDACSSPDLQGKTGSCAAVASRAGGEFFSLSANALTPVVGLKICFFSATLVELGCAEAEGTASSLSAIVPTGATRMSVTATVGLGLSWFFRAG